MSRNFTLILTLLFLASCGSKTIKKGERVPLKMIQNSAGINYNPSDFYALAAFDARYIGDEKSAAYYFQKLYESTKNIDFAYEAIRSYGAVKDYKYLKSFLDKLIKDYPNNPNLKRYLAAFYIDLKRYKEANEILKTLPIDKNRDVQSADEALKATALLGLGKSSKALKYFKNKYKQDKSAKNALILFEILYANKNYDKAFKVLKNHTDFVECDESICLKLIAYYKERNDLNSIIDLTKRLYENTKKRSYANMLLDLYQYKDDKKSAIEFLKNSHFDDKLLLSLYLSQKDYKEAKIVAKKLYHESGDIHLLAQIAMIEYEGAKKKDKNLLNSIIKKFDKVVKKVQDPLYDNFYGYILIDDNIDVDRGIKLVKRALKKKPNSIFFIDSLAWGYYKKGECQKALDTIEPIINLSKAKEIKEHYKKIKECQ